MMPLLEEQLARYGMNAAELEQYYMGASQLIQTKHEDALTMERLIRLAATNKALHTRGLGMLGGGEARAIIVPSTSASPSDGESTTEDALTAEELRVLGQYDGGGHVLGIPVGGPFYSACLLRCRSKKARLLQQRDDTDGFRVFILQMLKQLAQSELRREGLGLRRATLTIKERQALEAEYAACAAPATNMTQP